MVEKLVAVAALVLSAGVLPAAEAPSAEITNGEIRARLYLPDAESGFYRGTRFDWSGVIYSLQYKGHDYYGPWFDRKDPTVRDFEYQGTEIVAGPASGITGPADEFAIPLGWEQAQPGGTFVKIGVGALRRPDAAPYDTYRIYEAVDRGKWSVKKSADAVEFTHELSDAASGYGYVYQKTVRLSAGKAEMVLEHRLRNTGTRAIETRVYNHNFLVLDGQGPGAGVSVTVPFAIRTDRAPRAELAAIEGKRVVYRKTLTDRETVAMPVEGFGASASDHDIRIESSKAGAGVRIKGDQPLARVYLWSIRSVVSVEPFVAIAVKPGEEFSWSSRYSYYTLR